MALLAVNVPGFPVPRPAGLAASAGPTSLVAANVVGRGLTAADRRGALLNVARARAAGHDPDKLYPSWRERLR